MEGAFDLREYAPDDVVHAGPLSLRFRVVPHFVPRHAVEITSAADGAAA